MTSITCPDCDGLRADDSSCNLCNGYGAIDPKYAIDKLRKDLLRLSNVHNRVADEAIPERITRTFNRLANDLQFMLTDRMFDTSSKFGMIMGAGMVAWWRNIRKVLEPVGLDWQEAFVAFYGCMREVSTEVDGDTLRRLSSRN